LAVANKPDMKISETKYINKNIAGLPQKSMSFYSLNNIGISKDKGSILIEKKIIKI